MASVGLFYVGAVLFLNGVMILGKVDPKAAPVLSSILLCRRTTGRDADLSHFYGPKVIPDVILNASGIYLFGFTYLYVGVGLLAGLDTTGVGWFSLFVAAAAVGYSYANFQRLFGDRPPRRHLALLGLPVVPVLPASGAETGRTHGLYRLGYRH